MKTSEHSRCNRKRSPLTNFIKDFKHSFFMVTKRIEQEDVKFLKPESNLDIDNYTERFTLKFTSEKSLWGMLFGTLKKEFLLLFLIGIFSSLLTIAIPICLKYLFAFFEEDNTESILKMILSISLLLICKLLINAANKWKESKLILLVHQIMSRFLFGRLQKLDPIFLNKQKKDPLTFITTYAPQITQFIYIIDFIVTSLLLIALISVLFSWFGATSILLLMGMFIFTIVLQYMIVLIGKVYSNYMTLNHERISILKLVAEEIQSIRRQSLEPQFLLALQKVRSKQLMTLKKRANLQITNRTLEDSLRPLLSLFLICIVVWGNFGFVSKDIFPLLIILNMILDGIGNNLANFRVIMNTKGPTQELEKFLSDSENYYKTEHMTPTHENIDVGKIKIENRNSNKTNIINKGERIAVIARAGVGKSKLLARISKKYSDEESSALHVSSNGTSILVEKNILLFDASIAETITLFESKVDEEKYTQALTRSGLAKDLYDDADKDSKTLSNLEKNLSEGQIQRLMLAQALYFDSDILLLDDVFASLDSELAFEISNNILGDKNNNSTIIYTTNRLELLCYADRILILDTDDVVIYYPEEIIDENNKNHLIRVLGEDFSTNLIHACTHYKRPSVTDSSKTTNARKYKFKYGQSAPLTESYDTTARHSFNLRDYIKNVGSLFSNQTLIFLTFLLVGIVSSSIIFSYFIDNLNAGQSDTLGILIAITLLGILMNFIRYVLTYYKPIESIDNLHKLFFKKFLSSESIVKKNNQFISRMTQDFMTLEMELPNTLISLGMALILSVTYITFFVLVNPLYILLLIPCSISIWYLYSKVRNFIISSARFRASARGPVINFTGPALSNRGYNLSTPLRNAINKRFLFLSDLQSYGTYWSMLVNTKVSVMIEGIGTILLILTLWMLEITGSSALISASLAVYLAFNFTGHLSSIIEKLLQMDSNQTIFERLAELLQETVLPPMKGKQSTELFNRDSLEKQSKESIASKNNEIKVQNVSYTDKNDKVLFNNISFTLRVGESISIVGPSGVGKSTLAKILSGLVEADQGKVTICGYAPNKVSIHANNNIMTLESRVPLLSITIRDFIDPFKKQTDEELENYCSIFNFPRHSKLDALLTELSSGEIQTLNIIRAALDEKKMLILDEATSSTELAHERHIFLEMRRLRPRTSLIVILHRLNNLDCFEKNLRLHSEQQKN